MAAVEAHPIESHPIESPAALQSRSGRPKVVVVGAGFGGLTCVQALAKADCDVTLIDRRNYHLFQPLLYQVATAGLSPADIAWPIRGILAKQANANVRLGRVTGVDTARKVVLLGDAEVAYDVLVLATGARHSYFGKDEWEGVAPGLKKIDDATDIRRRLLVAFERAEVETDPEERKRLLTFVVVGGGPTGVEMAGAIIELAHHALAADFRSIEPSSARVLLVEAGPRLLASFPEDLSAKARTALEGLGVEVLTNMRVETCDATGISANGMRIEARTIVWGAGVIASPAAKWLGVEGDRVGRVPVQADLSVQGHPDIFVIGDTAAVQSEGKPVPGIAPAAKQMGAYVASLIAARVAKKSAPKPFVYHHQGNLATIGRKAAVVDTGRFRFSGFFAWVLWSIAHVYFLIGLKNRVVVGLNWMWSYMTFQRGARLITGDTN